MRNVIKKLKRKTKNEFDNEYGFGLGIHEMGTPRMGRDPKTSVFNSYNQVHGAVSYTHLTLPTTPYV